MTHSAVDFGVFLPQLQFSWDDIRSRVALAEQLGYHSAWFIDHMFPPGLPSVPCFEAWTTASALAMVTERIRLGHLVLCNSFRHPALLAKMAISLDVISNGRLELGIGSGSVADEQRRFGFPFPKFSERSRQLDEAVHIIKMMFTQEETSFSGEFYQVQNVPSLPRPVQKPNPPIHIGGGNDSHTLPIVARWADWWNCPTYSVNELERKCQILLAECARAGRDPSAIRISQQTMLVLVEKKEQIDEALAQALRRYRLIGWGATQDWFVGTPDVVVEQIKAKAKLGVSLFIFVFGDRAALESLRLFAREVMPAFSPQLA